MNTTKIRQSLKQRPTQLIIGVIVIALGFLLFGGDDTATDTDATTRLPVVTVTTATELQGGTSLSLIGTVRAFTEANITAERGGRVVSVPVTLGQAIRAGQVIASFENAAERASVLQAEGGYEAALAASAQSGVGVNEAQTALLAAKNNAVSVSKSSYSSVSSVVNGNIDTFFSQPEGFLPGLKVAGRGNTAFLNSERVAYQQLLRDWQTKSSTLTADSDLKSALATSRTNVERTVTFVDAFITIFNSGSTGGYSDTEVQTLSTNFTALKASLIGTIASIDAATASLASAEDNVRRASIAASGGTNSSADAQVKQALGSLRATQANLAKTILRSPISGTVNSLSVRMGDFIGGQTSVATVANNNALEIVTYIGESEQSALAVDDVVTIDGSYEGIVTQIAPAVDATTRKIEVRIATEATDIINGNTVRVTKDIQATSTTNVVLIPLTAIKFETTNGFMMTVVDGKLVQKPVTLGQIRGGVVEIVEGHTLTEPFVLDVRGLTAGSAVTVAE
jgi:multidrug efflux pump subunit AcrA (membrane-fusion protein)